MVHHEISDESLKEKGKWQVGYSMVSQEKALHCYFTPSHRKCMVLHK